MACTCACRPASMASQWESAPIPHQHQHQHQHQVRWWSFDAQTKCNLIIAFSGTGVINFQVKCC